MHTDLKSIKENILEELKDAVKYMQDAIDNKGTEIGTWYCMMSKNEVEHAQMLTKIFQKTKKPDTVTEAQHTEMYKELMDSYIDHMTKLEAMKKIYWSDI